ncbi:hypothetical protein I316_07102 [Kwoniella heveanensis BCC8398]|uniref:Uncharacterized protein n=1 Tax=Kwoniella heveanensis BCC8398 TaxID=1296120 RepID=A0A1B9GJY8_9TREE|nr:hypothetical protein I316_07102 [Kwoniella heveanensis BCC8398]
MRLSRNFQKLASAGATAGSSRPALVISSRNSSTSSAVAAEDRVPSTPSFHPENILGSVPRSPLPVNESSTKPVPSALHFFDSSSPHHTFATSTARAPPIPQPTSREADVVIELREMVQLSNAVRDEVFAARVWQKYNSLSPAYRRSLDIDFLQNVFRYILPNSRHMRLTVQTSKRDLSPSVLRSRLTRNSELGMKWERRMRTVAADMMSSSARKINPQVFINALDKLAFVGDKAGCEAIIKEIRHRYDDRLTYQQLRTMYTHALKSVSRWLRNHAHRHRTAQKEIMEAVETARRLILAMQEKDISPNGTTAENLLNISRIVSSTITDRATVDSFDQLSEAILTKGYSLDIANLAFGPEAVKLKPSVKLAIIDLLGRKGRLYEMLASFDALFPGDIDRLPSALVQDAAGKSQLANGLEEEDEVIPTLSAMIAAEQAGRAERGWFGQRVREDEVISAQASTTPEISEMSASSSSSADTPRQFNDFLPPIPTPFEILSPDSFSAADSSAASDIIARLQDPSSINNARPIDGEGAVVSSVLAMLSRAWSSKIHTSPNDTRYKDISVQILHIALRAAHVEQARWIHSLQTASSSNPSSSSSVDSNSSGSTSQLIEKPGLRVEPNWFNAVWRTVRWTRSSDRRGRMVARAVMMELEAARARLEEEKIIVGNLYMTLQEQQQQQGAPQQEQEQVQVDVSVTQQVQAEGLGAESSTLHTASPTSSEPAQAPSPMPSSLEAETPPKAAFDLMAHLTELEELSHALEVIKETINANVAVAIAKKARSNAARTVKLAERRELEALNLSFKGKKRYLLQSQSQSKASASTGAGAAGTEFAQATGHPALA